MVDIPAGKPEIINSDGEPDNSEMDINTPEITNRNDPSINTNSTNEDVVMKVPLAAVPTKLAFTNPISNHSFIVTSGYGRREHPFWGGIIFHNGIDLSVPNNSLIVAAADGVVLEAEYSISYGNYVLILHRNNYKTLYAHLNTLSVARGQKVEQGQKIGLSGNTGLSTGPHLHYEVRHDNKCIDPARFLAKH